jgi:hypothetical protein
MGCWDMDTVEPQIGVGFRVTDVEQSRLGSPDQGAMSAQGTLSQA